MKILMLGVGGVGGYFGARLVQAGADVTFLVRPARQARLARDGLRIESPYGNFQVSPRCVTAETLKPGYDVIVLAPKAFDLDSAIDTVAPAVGAETVVLPFLNGWSHLALLDARFGPSRVLGGVAHIAGELGADGVVRQLSHIHSLTVGGRDDATRAVAERFIAACSAAHFDSTLSQDITRVLWEKWVFLATLAGATTLMGAPVGAIVATPHGDALIRRLYGECVAIAEADGRAVSRDASGKALGLLTEPGSAFTASMLRDLQAGLPTEHEHVLGALVRIGEARACDLPLLTAALVHMQVRAAGCGVP
ncbi:MAG: ketopantoate reductase family protein [Rhodocyclaceae bacterium]|nr:ketopantoate reductase family protein [Rhodocyclaceae bacterium]